METNKVIRTSLPHNAEAERSILGSILINNETLSIVLDQGLESRDFYLDAHQKLFEIILFLSGKSQPIDLITISDQLKDRGWYEQIGGSSILTGILDDCFAVGYFHFLTKNRPIPPPHCAKYFSAISRQLKICHLKNLTSWDFRLAFAISTG